MYNKKTIKEIFDEKINKNKIYDNVLLNIGRKKRMNLFKVIVPTCIVTLICSILVLNNNKNLQNKQIVINKIENVIGNRVKIDGIIEKLDKDNKLEILNNIYIPSDIDKESLEAIYIKGENSHNYDNLYQYTYYYYSLDNERWISINFSNKNKPFRDYQFNDGKDSIINNFNLKIYQYENLYMTQFSYKGYNFDIETSAITEDELISLLETILK